MVTMKYLYDEAADTRNESVALWKFGPQSLLSRPTVSCRENQGPNSHSIGKTIEIVLLLICILKWELSKSSKSWHVYDNYLLILIEYQSLIRNYEILRLYGDIIVW